MGGENITSNGLFSTFMLFDRNSRFNRHIEM